MNKQRAKKLAHHLAYRAIQQILDHPGAVEDSCDNEGYYEEDKKKKIREALDDLAQHHFERSPLVGQYRHED